MFFLQAAQAPVPVTIGKGRKLSVPKYTMDDVVAWASEIQSELETKFTEGMESQRRTEYLQFNPVLQPDLSEIKRRLRTPDGIRQVIRKCFSKAGVAGAEIEALISANGVGTLGGIAWVLSDVDDSSMRNPNPQPPTVEPGESVPDPLTSSGTPA